jgi:hypothetical protein
MPATVSDLSQLAVYLPLAILRKHICAKLTYIFSKLTDLKHRDLFNNCHKPTLACNTHLDRRKLAKEVKFFIFTPRRHMGVVVV